MIISEGGGWFIDVFSVASSLRLAKQRCQLSFIGFSSLAMVAMSFSGHRHRCYLGLVANYPILDRPIFACMGRCFEEFATSTEWLEKICCWGGSEMPNGSKIALRPQISWRQRYGARRAFESPAIMAADFLRPIDLGFPLVPRFPGHGAQLGLSKKRVKVASCYMAFTAHAASSCDWSNSFILSQIKPALWGWVHRRKSKSHSKGRRLQKAEEESERYLRQLTLRWISDDLSMGQTGWHSTVNGSVSTSEGHVSVGPFGCPQNHGFTEEEAVGSPFVADELLPNVFRFLRGKVGGKMKQLSSTTDGGKAFHYHHRHSLNKL